MEKRVVFPQGKQKEFLKESKKELNVTWTEFAKLLEVERATLKTSYQYEYCHFPYSSFKKITELRKIEESETLTKYSARVIDIIYDISKLLKGQKRQIGVRIKKLPEIQISYTNQLPIFNTQNIENSFHDRKKGIILPIQLTSELAEEIGIHLGDGFLSSRRNEYRLKGDKKERDYYTLFIRQLFKKLYNLEINLKDYENTFGFELCSKSIWTFKNKVLGIKAGRKRYMNFPEIIKVNNKEVLGAFLRGIYDTDGSLSFRSSKKNKKYYPIIKLCLIAKNIIDGVAEILQMLGLEPYCYQDKRGYYNIALNGYARLERYCELIGWHNQKHIKKFDIWKENYPQLSSNIILRQ